MEKAGVQPISFSGGRVHASMIRLPDRGAKVAAISSVNH
jgi:hypothetical protein